MVLRLHRRKRPGCVAWQFSVLRVERLGDALRRLTNSGISLEGASDHGVSEALYLRDPDKNGIELYWDRPRNEWPRQGDGSLNMYMKPLDLTDLATHASAS
jgi:catechol 2,3-dioxygenase